MKQIAPRVCLTIVGLFMILAFNPQPAQESYLAQLVHDRTRWIGAPDTMPGMSSRGSLTRVVSGRIAPDGQHVVVLDSEAPFVKVFRRDGALRSEFIRKGGGPGEMRMPHTVAVNARNQLLVLDAPNRVQLYNLDGKRELDASVQDLALMDAVEGCAGGWLVYSTARGASGDNPWLSQLTVKDGALHHEPVYSNKERPTRIAFGNSRGMVNHSGDVVLDHRAGEERRLIEWRCGDKAPRARSLARLFDEFIPKEQRTANGLSLQLVEGMEMPSGVAVVQPAILFFDNVLVMGNKPPRAHVTIVSEGNKPKRYTVDAELRALDSRAGHGVLFAARDPYPHVMVVSENELGRALRLR